MTTKDTGGAAFPTEHTDTSGKFDGMTLRDYFAAQAMKTHMWALSRANLPDWNGEIARLSYLVADAMLAERNKQ